MNKPKLEQLIREAHDEWSKWQTITDNAVCNRYGKTPKQAAALCNYFEGKYDGLVLARSCDK